MNTNTVVAYDRGKKFLLWFGITFAGFFLPSLAEAALNFTTALDFNVLSAALVSAVMAAITATLRLMIAQFPIFRVDNNIGKPTS